MIFLATTVNSKQQQNLIFLFYFILFYFGGEEIQFLSLEFDRFQTLAIGASHKSLSNKV
jgi:hypothetical protein